MITKEQFAKAFPHARQSDIDKFYTPLASAMDEFSITTPARITQFLAQVAHESGSLRYVKELASGAAYDTGSKAKSLGNTPEADGDGQKYKGRGLIQLTGRANYQTYSKVAGVDFLAHPELLEQPKHSAHVAAWFWSTHNLNALADLNSIPSFEKITRKINGGLNGYADRLVRWSESKKMFS